ncbi:MAG: right-handed parallel beta-helix repeat-containing protein [Phaeodactylibacter sp.]|nr:right-handed parallel beta-helix repeat-containing protein [Phaeodactylibacter sp.]MCB9048858.1 right-handed parallel beta-helix repeat-containing protein [Lewinellaceae bacterium]
MLCYSYQSKGPATAPVKPALLRKNLFFFFTRPASALLVLALLLLSCDKAEGGTFYVDSENGSDSYDGRAATYEGGNSGPWKTISKVNRQDFLPGDSILFKRGGTWTDGPLEPRNGGNPGGVITITDSIRGQPISFQLVDPQNHNCIYFGAYGDSPQKPRINCRGGKGIVLLHNYIIVEGLHIDNGGNNMLWLGRENGNSWIIIDSVDVTHCSANAVRSSYGGGNIWLKDLYVYDYNVNGILLNGSPNNKLRSVLVEGCWVENPEVLELEDAITCHRDSEENDLAGNIIIRNNTTLRAGEDGIDITSGSNILVEGNVLKYSQAGGIYVNFDWVNDVEVRGNFLYSNSISQGYGDLTIRAPRVRAVNNIIAGAGHHSVLIGNTSQTEFWNNVLAPRNRTGNLIWLREGISNLDVKNNIFDLSESDQDISGDITANIVFDHNCYYGRSPEQEIYDGLSFQALRNERPEFEPNGMWADPKFAHPEKSEPEHFKISRFSSCINAGANLPVALDHWKTARPQNGKPDLGAHEVIISRPQNNGSISGRAWHDQNGNCARDANEPGIPKLIINLYGPDGKFYEMAYSSSDGNFRFDGLPPGPYRLAAAPSNFNPGNPLEYMAPGCSNTKAVSGRNLSLEADASASNADLGFRPTDGPAVEMAEFQLEEGQDKVELRWSTSREKDIDYFEIERSDNGREFFIKGQVKSKEAPEGQNRSYRFIDEEPPGRLTYYRLKQVSRNGSFSYSDWKLANGGDKPKGIIQLSPNPVTAILTLSLKEGATADKLWMINQKGKEVFEKRIRDAKDLSLNLSALPSGAYYLIVRSDKESNILTAYPVVKQ